MTHPLIAHHSTGTGAPVLLLNGGLMTMMTWEPIATRLATEYRVVRCDFRGQVMSPGEPPATLEGHADDVVAVLDALSVASAHVVGTSFGALVGVVLAARHPRRVRSLIAANATDRFTAEDWQNGLPIVEACRAAAAGTRDGGVVLDLLFPGTFSPAYLEANRAMLADRRNRLAAMPSWYFAGLCGILSVLEGMDLRAAAARIKCPALVLAAEADVTFPLERSRALASAIPDGALRILSGAPHGVVVETPDAVFAPIRQFLTDVEAMSRA